jgi:hypothetical protein
MQNKIESPGSFCSIEFSLFIKSVVSAIGSRLGMNYASTYLGVWEQQLLEQSPDKPHTYTPKPYGIDFLTVFGWSDRLWRYICLFVGFSYSFVFKNPLSKTVIIHQYQRQMSFL